MKKLFRVAPMTDSGILLIYSLRDRIQIDPTYQRIGDIWTLEKKQLLIDSIINGFDIPKIYFHEFESPHKVGKRTYDFAIVDGRQRLEAIWEFIDNGFALSKDFVYLRDSSVVAKSMTYSGLAEKLTDLKIQFDQRSLPITSIRTDDIELIEEMFSRLNEAVPLNAAEKRNAWGGTMPPVIRGLSKHKFFAVSLPFANNRYRHYDVATKFLLIEHEGGVTDTKKVYLDRFVLEFKEKKQSEADALKGKCTAVLDALAAKFAKDDKLLQSVGMVTLYYLLFREAQDEGWWKSIDRSIFQKFEDLRAENRELAEADIAQADYDLLEFDRYSQSPNDGIALKYRLEVIKEFVLAAIGRVRARAKRSKKAGSKRAGT